MINKYGFAFSEIYLAFNTSSQNKR